MLFSSSLFWLNLNFMLKITHLYLCHPFLQKLVHQQKCGLTPSALCLNSTSCPCSPIFIHVCEFKSSRNAWNLIGYYIPHLLYWFIYSCAPRYKPSFCAGHTTGLKIAEHFRLRRLTSYCSGTCHLLSVQRFSLNNIGRIRFFGTSFSLLKHKPIYVYIICYAKIWQRAIVAASDRKIHVYNAVSAFVRCCSNTYFCSHCSRTN